MRELSEKSNGAKIYSEFLKSNSETMQMCPHLLFINDVISIGHFFKEFQYIKSMQATFDCYEIIIIEKNWMVF